jgi:hypothetical protein
LAFTAMFVSKSAHAYVLLAILLPIRPPADSLVLSGTAQSPVPFAQLLGRIPCPTCAAKIASTLDRSVVARCGRTHIPDGILLILASQ